MSDIILPHNWHARPHQKNFFKNMLPVELGGLGLKRGVDVWHRRAGKDSSSLNYTAVMSQHKVATYWHMLPTAIQGRHVVWDAIDPRTGIRSIDQAFPKELRAKMNETDMIIKFKNGSTWQVVGSDNYNRLVGSNPYGIVFSEYSVSDPSAWDYLSPILVENGGFATFPYTPRGKNHGHRMYEQAAKNPKWHCELLTIEDTFKEDGTPVFTQQDYQDQIDEEKDPLFLLQEYYCSFDAGMIGAYYTNEMKHTKVGEYPWNPRKPVHTFWDIGYNDPTSIWFGQETDGGDAINVIDYETSSNKSFAQWVGEIRSKGYTYGIHSLPHDFKAVHFAGGAGAAGPSIARELGFDWEPTPDIPLAQGMDAVRTFLPRLRFDNNPNVMSGRDGLLSYRREWNSKLNIWMNRPLHDWASNPADAMRYMAIAWPENYHRTGRGQFGIIPAIRSASGGRRKPTPRAARRY